MKEFIIIPVLFILYFYAVNFFVSTNLFIPEQASTEFQMSGGEQSLSVGNSASVMVTRGYLFGLYRIPVFTSSLGDLSWYHNAFFVSVSLLTMFLIYRRIKLVNKNPWQRTIRL